MAAVLFEDKKVKTVRNEEEGPEEQGKNSTQTHTHKHIRCLTTPHTRAQTQHYSYFIYLCLFYKY